MTGLMTDMTAILGCIALELGLFVLGKPPPLTLLAKPQRRGAHRCSHLHSLR